MKTAANIVAVAAWIAFLGALWFPLAAAEMPPMGLWIGAVVLTFLTGLVVPSYLINLEERAEAQRTERIEKAIRPTSRHE